VKIPPFLPSVAAGDDFYSYINGRWLRSTPIPKFTSSYGISEEVEDYIRISLLKSLRECRSLAEKGEQPANPEEHLRDSLGRLMMSSMRPEKQKYSIQYLKRGIRSIGCLRDKDDIARVFGFMSRFRIPTVMTLDVELATRPSGERTYLLTIDSGGVGLPDLSYYRATGPGKTEVLYAYTKLLRTATKELDLDDVSHIIPLEAQISAMLEGDEVDTRNREIPYLRFSELKRQFRKVPWETMLEAYGLQPSEMSRIMYRVRSEQWVRFIEAQMEETPLEQWYSLFSSHTLLHAMPYLPAPFDTLHHELFGKKLQGQEEKLPQELLSLKVAKEKMSESLGHLFIRDVLDEKFRAETTHFVRKILDIAADRMSTVEWFSQRTRRRAVAKLRATDLCVDYSEFVYRQPKRNPALQTDNFLANIYLLEGAATDTRLDLIRHPSEEALRAWSEPPFLVNAFYYNENNQLVIPAASFFWPFYNLAHQEWLGWNYGGLGAIIGHEITHAFDKEGQDYDEKGRDMAWWTKEDKRAYTEKTQDLIRLYNKATVMGRPVNGAATLNENVADLGGLGIALDGLKREMKRAGLSAAARRRQLQEFFISYAVSWRTKEKPERAVQRLFLDKHAPVELRVNLIVSQFDEWYEAFGVRTEDDLYIPPEERIRIF
jgi:putative endopeptidase